MSEQPDSIILKNRLLSLLQKRDFPKTACPSETPRSLSRSELRGLGVAEWRDLIPSMRELAFNMRDQGEIEILQKGEVVGSEVGMDDVKGPIRVRLRRDEAEERGC